MTVRAGGAALAAMLVAGGIWTHAANVSKQHAESFLRKVELVQQHGDDSAPRTPRRTSFSEAEVNSWFAYHAGSELPTGVTRPALTIVGNQRVTGTATVDLDAVARSRASGRTFDIWNLVGGRVPVTVTGLVHARGGRARFEMQEADVAGIPVPRRMVEELVEYYSRSPERPSGVRLDQEYQLPSRIERIDIAPGAAVVVQ